MTVYQPEQYHTWIGYNWKSYTDFVTDRIAAYTYCDDNFSLGFLSAIMRIQFMIEKIEALPGMLNGYDAFSLLCAWSYLHCEELHGKTEDEYHRAEHGVYEDCYASFLNDYAETPDMLDVYAYVTRLYNQWVFIPYSQSSAFSNQINKVYQSLSVKKPRGTKQHQNTDLGIGDVRAMLGACVMQAIVSPYEDAEKQARIAALCKVLHKVFS
jgi:hypothetical protein